MVAVIEQLCIKSYEITAQNGDYFKAEQGRQYTTTVPRDDKETVTVFSRHWVPVPKEHFVPVERRSGDHHPEGCSCHINPPCSYCMNRDTNT